MAKNLYSFLPVYGPQETFEQRFEKYGKMFVARLPVKELDFVLVSVEADSHVGNSIVVDAVVVVRPLK